MDKRESMWDVYLRKGMSRRSFVKGCVALTSLMGLSTDKLEKVVEAAEKKPLPVVIWIHGHECTGCDESFIRSGSPYASDVILSQVALEYDHLLSAASGECDLAQDDIRSTRASTSWPSKALPARRTTASTA